MLSCLKNNLFSSFIFIALLGLSACNSTNKNELPHWYDPNRDALVDLELASQLAGDRKILVIIGGDWCSWCHLLNKYFESNKKVYDKLKQTFVVLKVNFSDENENPEFFNIYPPAKGYPHFIILDKNKKYLGQQDTSQLESGESYSDDAILAFVNKWQI